MARAQGESKSSDGSSDVLRRMFYVVIDRWATRLLVLHSCSVRPQMDVYN
jgi:hypothetical protein